MCPTDKSETHNRCKKGYEGSFNIKRLSKNGKKIDKSKVFELTKHYYLLFITQFRHRKDAIQEEKLCITKMFLNTIIRIATITSQKHNFRIQSSSNKHIFRTLKQEMNLKAMKRLFKKLIYQHRFGKFSASEESLKQDVIERSKEYQKCRSKKSQVFYFVKNTNFLRNSCYIFAS